MIDSDPRMCIFDRPILVRRLEWNPRMSPLAVVCHGTRASCTGRKPPIKLRKNVGNPKETSDGVKRLGTHDVQSRNR